MLIIHNFKCIIFTSSIWWLFWRQKFEKPCKAWFFTSFFLIKTRIPSCWVMSIVSHSENTFHMLPSSHSYLVLIIFSCSSSQTSDMASFGLTGHTSSGIKFKSYLLKKFAMCKFVSVKIILKLFVFNKNYIIMACKLFICALLMDKPKSAGTFGST